jgi:hypothetical protein
VLAGSLVFLQEIVDIKIAMDSLDMVAHIVFTWEATVVSLARWNRAKELVCGVHAVRFFLVSGQDRFGGKLHVLAVWVSADIGLECGFKMFATSRC